MRDGFEASLWSLCQSNPKEDEEMEQRRSTAEYDRLLKIKLLYTGMMTACQVLLQPYQNICVNERMVASRACISMKQHMKDKPTK